MHCDCKMIWLSFSERIKKNINLVFLVLTETIFIMTLNFKKPCLISTWIFNKFVYVNILNSIYLLLVPSVVKKNR